AVGEVAGDEVAGPTGGPADRVGARALNLHTDPIGQSGGAGDIGADEVALHQVAGRTIACNEDALAAIAGDEVAGPAGGPADRVGARVLNLHAPDGVGQSGGAGDIGADEIALHGIAGRAAARNGDAVDEIA